MSAGISDGVSELVGRTPLVRLHKVVEAGGAELLVKHEAKNPSGSVKDRPALAMIADAEARGTLRAGSTIVEATSGNTGISLAMIAAVRGYRCVLVMPEDMSLERRYILRAYGAEIVLTPATEGMAGAVSRARRVLEDTPSSFMPSQFTNSANPESHEHGTALEILEQVGGSLAAFVAGVGTGGTITGVSRTLRKKLGKNVKVFAVEPSGSAVLSGKPPGMHGIQGLGAGFVPEILDRSLIDKVLEVSDVAAERRDRRRLPPAVRD